MNAKIRDHVAKYNAAKGWDTTDESIIETIMESHEVWRGDESPHRWWTTCFMVTEIDGMLIGYVGAITTGDDSPSDKGWSFDPDSICEVEAKEVKAIVYVRKA